ncbi:hypothetical protein GQ42DRAFT_177442 [Ramicandelaber brevisporus]|nr:hypothetical protein GQ42DRAFT_177442 [Ramicandelaber brevisporus]
MKLSRMLQTMLQLMSVLALLMFLAMPVCSSAVVERDLDRNNPVDPELNFGINDAYKFIAVFQTALHYKANGSVHYVHYTGVILSEEYVITSISAFLPLSDADAEVKMDDIAVFGGMTNNTSRLPSPESGSKPVSRINITNIGNLGDRVLVKIAPPFDFSNNKAQPAKFANPDSKDGLTSHYIDWSWNNDIEFKAGVTTTTLLTETECKSGANGNWAPENLGNGTYGKFFCSTITKDASSCYYPINGILLATRSEKVAVSGLPYYPSLSECTKHKMNTFWMRPMGYIDEIAKNMNVPASFLIASAGSSGVLSGGAIAGIVCGAVALISAVGYLTYHNRKIRSQRDKMTEAAVLALGALEVQTAAVNDAIVTTTVVDEFGTEVPAYYYVVPATNVSTTALNPSSHPYQAYTRESHYSLSQP